MARFLEQTLIKWASTPCSRFPCGQDTWDYACLVSGVPLSKLPDHDTEASKEAYLESENGLVALAGKLLASLGWKIAANPEQGDIAVLEVETLGRVCSIYTGDKWALRGNRRVILLTPEAVRIVMLWRNA